MFIFVFRRLGMIIPVCLFVPTVLLLVARDKIVGAEDGSSNSAYSNPTDHLGLVGLGLVLGGLLMLFAALKTPPSSSTSSSATTTYDSVATSGGGKMDSMDIETAAPVTISPDVGITERLQQMIAEPDMNHHFCFIPLNTCAVITTFVGCLVLIVGVASKIAG